MRDLKKKTTIQVYPIKLQMMRPKNPGVEKREAKIHPVLKEKTPEPTERVVGDTPALKHVGTNEWTQNTF